MVDSSEEDDLCSDDDSDGSDRNTSNNDISKFGQKKDKDVSREVRFNRKPRKLAKEKKPAGGNVRISMSIDGGQLSIGMKKKVVGNKVLGTDESTW